MPTPTTAAGQVWLDAVAAAPSQALFAFDFDGTLSPIVPDPEDAVAHPQAPGLLRRLAERYGHVAVITGRPTRVVVERLSLTPGPGGVDVYGHYGAERWDGRTGDTLEVPPDPGLEQARHELAPLLIGLDAADAYVEDKGAAVAVHTRRTHDPAGMFARLRQPLSDLAARTGLVVEPGRLVLELRPPGTDKGSALRLAHEQAGAGSVAFVGDDLGDLAAFDAVDRLREDGVPGLLVCSGSSEVTELADRADLVVDGPDGVVGWLDALLR